MTRRLRALNGGRLRVWWVHHRQEARNHALFSILVGLWLVASYFDHQDAILAERIARKSAETRAERAEGFVQDLPRVAFIIDARTKQDLIDRLAEIAGATDRERGEILGGK